MNNKFSKISRNLFSALFLFGLNLGAFVFFANAQVDGNKEVAIITVKSGDKRTIKYSDLLFQLALEPNAPLNPPETKDLKRVLQTLINLGLIANELGPLLSSCLVPTEAEIQDQIRRSWSYSRSPAEFEKRFQLIGFVSINDDNFRRQISARAGIEKWVNFRFRLFLIIPREEEEKYYRDVFAADFRRRNPGLLLPELKQIRPQIRQILEEKRVESEIQRFLDYARQQVKIEILSEELK